jgi:hypothetical protein
MSRWTIEAPTSLGFADVTQLRVRLPAAADARVHLNAMAGDVRSEFTELKNASSPASRRVSGSLGAGSAHVTVTSMSGRVILLRRAERRTTPGDAGVGTERADNESEMEGEAS